MRIKLIFLAFYLFGFSINAESAVRDTVYLRINQVGYLEEDQKVAIAFSENPVKGNFTVGETVENTKK